MLLGAVAIFVISALVQTRSSPVSVPAWVAAAQAQVRASFQADPNWTILEAEIERGSKRSDRIRSRALA